MHFERDIFFDFLTLFIEKVLARSHQDLQSPVITVHLEVHEY
jgi:hypothetical protein